MAAPSICSQLAVRPLKRGFSCLQEVPENQLNCSPHRIQFLDLPRKAPKRKRVEEPEDVQMDCNASMSSSGPNEQASMFYPASKRLRSETAHLARSSWPKKYARRSLADSSTSSARGRSRATFSQNEVEKIVEHVVTKVFDDIEEKLRAEYSVVLRQALQEQLKQFTQFNLDNVSRDNRHASSYIS
eukprot:174677_1